MYTHIQADRDRVRIPIWVDPEGGWREIGRSPSKGSSSCDMRWALE